MGSIKFIRFLAVIEVCRTCMQRHGYNFGSEVLLLCLGLGYFCCSGTWGRIFFQTVILGCQYTPCIAQLGRLHQDAQEILLDS